jgi:hypothetical protein
MAVGPRSDPRQLRLPESLSDIPSARWKQVRDDFARFCDLWAGPAEAMGWRPADLLGWDPYNPYSPSAKHFGLAWKFDGASVVEVTRDAMTIVRDGVRTTLPAPAVRSDAILALAEANRRARIARKHKGEQL